MIGFLLSLHEGLDSKAPDASGLLGQEAEPSVGEARLEVPLVTKFRALRKGSVYLEEEKKGLEEERRGLLA